MGQNRVIAKMLRFPHFTTRKSVVFALFTFYLTHITLIITEKQEIELGNEANIRNSNKTRESSEFALERGSIQRF